MTFTFSPSDMSDYDHSPFGRGEVVIGVHFQSSGSVGRDVGVSTVLPAGGWQGRNQGYETSEVQTM